MHEATGVEEAVETCRRVRADVLMAEHDLGDGAIALIERIKRDPELFRTAIVVMAGEDVDVATALAALDRGADDILRTPLHPADLVGRAFAAARTKALVEELTAQNDRLEELVFFDELTGLRNRRAVLHELEMLLAGARRHGHHLSVLMLDVDRFKPINDHHGHRAGDDVLRAVAKRLTGRLRREDLAGRLGGDELLVVLPDTDGTGAGIVADSIREAIGERPVRTSAGPIDVTVSIGIAQWDTEDLTRLLEEADRALYAAKAGGRDRSVAA
jgi:two-component system cell cycle response regulator